MYSYMKIDNGKLFFKGTFLLMLISVGILAASSVFAAAPTDLGGLATNITNSFQSFGTLMIAIAYLAGIGFVLGGIFKFKQHKDNPTQIPLGTPLALLVVGIILIFLPAIFEPAGKSVFGDNASQNVGGFKGEGAGTLPGASKTTP
jgi:intracellular multiplication protein IcmD